MADEHVILRTLSNMTAMQHDDGSFTPTFSATAAGPGGQPAILRTLYNLRAIRHEDGSHTPVVQVAAASDQTIPSLISALGYAAVVVQEDEAGALRATELAVQDEDGAVPQWVLDRWSDRLGVGSRPAGDGTWLHPSGDRVPYDLDTTVLMAAGSSSTARSHTVYGEIATDYGATFVGLGQSATVASYTMAQLGARPPRLTIADNTIPASGTVEVTTPDLPHYNCPSFPGRLAGVAGRLSRTAPENPLIFTRTGSGDPVTIDPDTPLVSDHRQYRDAIAIIETGKNDVNVGRSAAGIVADIIELERWFAPYVRRTIILGQFPNLTSSGPQKRVINDINARLKERFGNQFVDQLAWFLSARLWQDLAAESVTPVQQDYVDQEGGYVPATLMNVDQQHLSDDAYGYRAKYLIRPKLIELGIFQETFLWP